jgi:ABC-type glycerol-3-phosphate transport system substrate-binding protein
MFFRVAAPCARRAVRENEAIGARHREDVFAFHYDLDRGRPRISSPGLVYALKLLQRLRACRPKEPTARPEEAFAAGRAVLCLTDASWLVAFQKSPAVHDKVGIAPVPGSAHYFTFAGQKKEVTGDVNRVPYLGAGGWLAAVSKSSAQGPAAWHLLASLTGPEGSNQIVLEPLWGGPVARDQADRGLWGGYDLAPRRAAALREAVRAALVHGLKNPVVRLRTPDQETHRSALVREVWAALQGKGAEEALQQAAARWAELDRAKGPEKTRAEYRLSLGLLAR